MVASGRITVDLEQVPRRAPPPACRYQEWLAGLAQGTMLKRLPTLSDVAEAAAFLASDRAGAMTGTVASLSGGFVVD